MVLLKITLNITLEQSGLREFQDQALGTLQIFRTNHENIEVSAAARQKGKS